MSMEKIQKRLDKYLEWTLVLIFGLMVLNVLWQVFTRFLLKDPSSYTEELARYLLIWLGLLGASYMVGKRLHLAIDVLTIRLSGKKKIISEIFIQLCIFIFSASVILIGGIHLVSLTLLLGQKSAALQLKLGYIYLVLPLSGIIMMFYTGVSILNNLKKLKENG